MRGEQRAVLWLHLSQPSIHSPTLVCTAPHPQLHCVCTRCHSHSSSIIRTILASPPGALESVSQWEASRGIETIKCLAVMMHVRPRRWGGGPGEGGPARSLIGVRHNHMTCPADPPACSLFTRLSNVSLAKHRQKQVRRCARPDEHELFWHAEARRRGIAMARPSSTPPWPSTHITAQPWRWYTMTG
jgi:hypothetical protein